MATRVKIEFIASVQQAIAGIQGVYSATKKVSSQIGGLGQALTGFGSTMTRNITVPIVAGFGLAARESVNFEKELINASRALDFTAKETKEFSKQARTIAPSLGLMPESFTNLASEAGKLGVASKDILEFSKNTAIFAAATDTNATLLAQRLASIKSVYGSTNQELLRFSAITNLLDDKVGGTASEILQFSTRLAGVGKTAGLSAEQIAAIGATFLKLGRNAGDAATGTNTLLVNLVSATRLSQKAQNALGELGTSAEEVQQWMRTNPQEGLLRFLKLASEFKGDRLGVLTDVFGRLHAPKIIALAESYHELNRAFNLTTQTQFALNKLNAETEKRLSSSAGQLSIFKAQMSNLAITVGTALLPALNSILKSVTPLIVKFANWAEANPKLLEQGLIIAGIVAAIGPLVIIIGTVISAISAIAPVVAAVGAVVGSIGGAVLAVIALVVAAIVGIATHWQELKRNIADNQAIKNFHRLWVNVSTGVVNSLTGMGEGIKNFIGNVHVAFAGVENATGNFLNSLHNFFTRTVPQFFDGVGKWFHDAGKYLMLTFARGIESKVKEALRPIIDFTNKVRSYLPSSNAKVGALSTLTQAGRALFDTFARGINDRPAIQAVGVGAQHTRDAMLLKGAAQSAIAFNSTPYTPSPAGSNITINFSPTINTNGGDADRNIIDQLREYERELLELLERAENRINRGGL